MPRNYQELRKQAMEQMNLQVWALEDRAKTLRRFASRMHACKAWSPETYERVLRVADIEKENDHQGLHALFRIVDNWPDASLEPGEGGYW